ncbi:MAG TPA: hypothetical protein VFU63_06780, partial [Ktedonobacterales bacterium]|nr:hypothetical protein [Ktedonobacterales bacterium]
MARDDVDAISVVGAHFAGAMAIPDGNSSGDVIAIAISSAAARATDAQVRRIYGANDRSLSGDLSGHAGLSGAP